jgi:hypothetical protein
MGSGVSKSPLSGHVQGADACPGTRHRLASWISLQQSGWLMEAMTFHRCRALNRAGAGPLQCALSIPP